jgi:actin-related protein
MLLDTEIPVNVVKSYNPQLDAWNGGRLFAEEVLSQDQDLMLTKAEYQECGAHYLKEHFCSNKLYGKAKADAAAFRGNKVAKGKR